MVDGDRTSPQAWTGADSGATVGEGKVAEVSKQRADVLPLSESSFLGSQLIDTGDVEVLSHMKFAAAVRKEGRALWTPGTGLLSSRLRTGGIDPQMAIGCRDESPFSSEPLSVASKNKETVELWEEGEPGKDARQEMTHGAEVTAPSTVQGCEQTSESVSLIALDVASCGHAQDGGEHDQAQPHEEPLSSSAQPQGSGCNREYAEELTEGGDLPADTEPQGLPRVASQYEFDGGKDSSESNDDDSQFLVEEGFENLRKTHVVLSRSVRSSLTDTAQRSRYTRLLAQFQKELESVGLNTFEATRHRQAFPRFLKTWAQKLKPCVDLFPFSIFMCAAKLRNVHRVNGRNYNYSHKLLRFRDNLLRAFIQAKKRII